MSSPSEDVKNVIYKYEQFKLFLSKHIKDSHRINYYFDRVKYSGDFGYILRCIAIFEFGSKNDSIAEIIIEEAKKYDKKQAAIAYSELAYSCFLEDPVHNFVKAFNFSEKAISLYPFSRKGEMIFDVNQTLRTYVDGEKLIKDDESRNKIKSRL